VIGEPSGWDAVTVAYKGRLGLRVSVARPARHGAAPGPTCTEEALALWSEIRTASDERTVGESGFAKLDCRLEGIQGGIGDGMTERAELRVGYRVPPGIRTAELEEEVRRITSAYRGEAVVTVERIGSEEPVRTPRSTPLARAFVGAIAGAGGSAAFKVKSGTSDMNILAPAWGCPMVAYGPGDSRFDHTPVERLALSDYARGIAVLEYVLQRLGKP
jgi:LysW-gamma-L-lysine carboxypeptidase